MEVGARPTRVRLHLPVEEAVLSGGHRPGRHEAYGGCRSGQLRHLVTRSPSGADLSAGSLVGHSTKPRRVGPDATPVAPASVQAVGDAVEEVRQ